jgi:hypothetical protein
VGLMAADLVPSPSEWQRCDSCRRCREGAGPSPPLVVVGAGWTRGGGGASGGGRALLVTAAGAGVGRGWGRGSHRVGGPLHELLGMGWC